MTARRYWTGVVALAGVALVGSGCGISLQSFPKFGAMSGPSYQLHAEFQNVLNLPANAQVRDGSAVIGQVTGITTKDFHADLTLKIRKSISLPAGTTAEVRFDSPLGDEFVVLNQPTTPTKGPPLADGAVLTTAQTSTAPSVEDTLSALSAVLNGGGIDQLQTIITELNATLTGNQPQIRLLLEEISTAVTSFAGNDPAIDNALTAVGTLSQQLNSNSAIITTGIDTLAPAVSVLANENGDLQQLLTHLTELSTVANSVVNQSGQATITDIKELKPVVDQLVSVESQLGPTLTDLQKFEQSTPKIAPGNYLQTSLVATANFGTAPINATNIPNTGVPQSAASSSSARAVTALLESGLP